MSSTRALFLTIAASVSTPLVAHAGWGDESWGELVWGASPGAPVPVPDVIWPLLFGVLLGLGARTLAQRRRSATAALLLVALAVPLVAYATTISMPNVFSNGTIADADEVNANFDTVVVESNAQDARLSALEATDITSVTAGTGLTGGGSSGGVNLDADTSYLQRRVVASCPAGQAIRAIDGTGGVTCETDDVGSGDITSVLPGSALVGGGTSGAVTLGVGFDDITSTHLAADSVDSSEIAAGAVRDSEVSASAAIDPSKIAGTAATLSYTTQNFGGVLYLDNNNDRVGINDTTPGRALDIDGDVRADGFDFRFGRSYRHFLRPSDFAASTTNSSWQLVSTVADYGYTNDESFDTVYATLHLPQGANITSLTCYYYDHDALLELNSFDANVYARLILSPTVFYELGSFISNPINYIDTDIHSVWDSTISGTGDPVDNGFYNYVVRLGWDLATPGQSGGDHSDVRFYGCQVVYSMSTVAMP